MSSPSKLNQLYILSLSSIAALSIVGQVFIQKQLDRQSTDIAIISAAQTRKQLCESLLKATLATRIAERNDRAAAFQSLEQTIQLWESSRHDLKQQMMPMLSQNDQAEFEAALAKLKPLSDEILSVAKLTLEPRSGNVRDRLQQATSVPRLIKTGTEFNQKIDNIITWYNQKAKDGIARLKLLEFGLLGLTLGTLLLEALLIFRPAIARLKQSLTALEQSLNNLGIEQEKSEKLLLNILPETIADRLKHSPKEIAESFTEATVLFADIVGFTELSSRLSPEDLVRRLNQIFSSFDRLAEKHGLEKIKTIGDAYMVVGGLPIPRTDHAQAIARMALDMQTELQALNRSMGENFDIRIGINSGPVVAGVIGIKKFIYDLWGDTVNIASRMESHGKPGQIQISETTYRLLNPADSNEFHCAERGVVKIKGKGDMMTYWLRSLEPEKNVADRRCAVQ